MNYRTAFRFGSTAPAQSLLPLRWCAIWPKTSENPPVGRECTGEPAGFGARTSSTSRSLVPHSCGCRGMGHLPCHRERLHPGGFQRELSKFQTDAGHGGRIACTLQSRVPRSSPVLARWHQFVRHFDLQPYSSRRSAPNHRHLSCRPCFLQRGPPLDSPWWSSVARGTGRGRPPGGTSRPRNPLKNHICNASLLFWMFTSHPRYFHWH